MATIVKNGNELRSAIVVSGLYRVISEPVFEEYPKSDFAIMKEQLEQQQADLDYLKLLSGDEEV